MQALFDENRLNRLISATNDTNMLEFAYDGLGRRRIKKTYTSSGTDWILESENRYVYDGYNLIASFYGDTGNLLKSRTWGEDGLISETDHVEGKTYLAAADGNRNITAYIDASDGSVAASYEYDPFGRTISKSGANADDFTFRFASYQYDTETGLIYMIMRYYDPETGRFPSRDPKDELGFRTATKMKVKSKRYDPEYVFVFNDSINHWDLLGLVPRAESDNEISNERIAEIKKNVSLSASWHITGYIELGAGMSWPIKHAKGTLKDGNNKIKLKKSYEGCPIVVYIKAVPVSGYKKILRPKPVQYLHKQIREPYYHPVIHYKVGKYGGWSQLGGMVLGGDLWVRYWNPRHGGGVIGGRAESVVYEEEAVIHINPDYKLKRPKEFEILIHIKGNDPESDKIINFIHSDIKAKLEYEK